MPSPARRSGTGPAGAPTVSIRSIGTAVPPAVLQQGAMRDILLAQPALGRLGRRLVGAAFDASAIDTRHTVLDDLAGAPGDGAPLMHEAATNTVLTPSTGARNAAYVERAPELCRLAATRALASGDVAADDITHVITVSCTGFAAPGPDLWLVRDLGLAATTQRYHLGFMGCYGAFPALRMARDVCRADPEAVVLVVCIELCSLHLQVCDDPDAIVAASLFADGAAAAVVTGRRAPAGAAVLDLDAFAPTVVQAGEAEMAWSIGDTGFDMVLSSYVPRIVEEHIAGALAPLLEAAGGTAGVDRWAVHPGGRSILDKVVQALDLAPDALDGSRAVLREVGNLSSATILFVLKRILEGAAPGPAPERVCAMAFGPGLTVETALLTRRTAA